MIEDRDWPAAELARLHAAVPATYQAKAAAWDARRSRSFREQPWIDRTVAGLRRRESVLDLGCGAGRPIAGYLIGRGFRVTGLDIAPAMLDIARSRYPDAAWVEGDMRVAPLPAGLGAIIGWDSAFHLSGAEQAVLIGHARPYLTAIVTGKVDAAAIQAAIDRVNAEVPHYRKIRKYLHVPEPLTIESGLLTANQKLRRRVIEKHFLAELDRLYASS